MLWRGGSLRGVRLGVTGVAVDLRDAGDVNAAGCCLVAVVHGLAEGVGEVVVAVACLAAVRADRASSHFFIRRRKAAGGPAVLSRGSAAGARAELRLTLWSTGRCRWSPCSGFGPRFAAGLALFSNACEG